MKFNPDMIWQSIPKQVFAIQFTGDNLEEIKKFAEEHRFTVYILVDTAHVYIYNAFQALYKGYWLITNEDYKQDMMSNEDFLSNYTKVKE